MQLHEFGKVLKRKGDDMTYSRIQKLITLSPQLFEQADQKAEELGLSFPDYVRHLIVNDVHYVSDDWPSTIVNRKRFRQRLNWDEIDWED